MPAPMYFALEGTVSMAQDYEKQRIEVEVQEMPQQEKNDERKNGEIEMTQQRQKARCGK